MKHSKSLIYIVIILIISCNPLVAADFYWVGGTGDYSNNNSWANASGGAPGFGVPAAGDNVFFDDNSGLTTTDVVNIDQAINCNNFDFSGVTNTFTFNASIPDDHVFTGNITGNFAGVTFNGAWGDFLMQSDGEVTLESNGVTWVQNYSFENDTVYVVDDFNIGNAVITVEEAKVDFVNITVNCGQFLAPNVGTTNISIENSTILISEGNWTLNNSALIFNANNSEINFTNALIDAEFNGGGQDYSIVRSGSNTQTMIISSNSFEIFENQPFTPLILESNSINSFDSLLIEGSCTNQADLFPSNMAVSAEIIKTGHPFLNLSGIDVNNVDITSGGQYNLSSSLITNASGWDLAQEEFYWINDNGDWNDLNHWSLTSGGASAGCLPTQYDKAIFDENSFSGNGFQVIVDDSSFIGEMEWKNNVGQQVLSLDSSLFIFGNAILTQDLTVNQLFNESAIVFKKSGTLLSDNALIDCNISVFMEESVEELELLDDLIMTDSSSIIFTNGIFDTKGFDVSTGTMISLGDPNSVLDERQIILNDSYILLGNGFNSMFDDDITLDAGTSYIQIENSTNKPRFLTTEGLDFYDVELTFLPISINQEIAGDNSFNKLKINAGSHVYFEDSSTQTVSDSLLILGTCEDSVFLMAMADSANINMTGAANQTILRCINVEDVEASGNTLTTYFSTEISGATNWVFDPAPSSTPSFTVDGPFCYGDTTFLTNNSTVFSGDQNDLSSYWYFNDGSTGYFLNPPSDSTFITYESDTNAHVFETFDSINVVLETRYLGCINRDTTKIKIINSNFSLISPIAQDTVCYNREMTFEANSLTPDLEYEFYLNGVSQNIPSVNDTIYTIFPYENQDTVGLVAYEEGCKSDTMYIFTRPVFPNLPYTLTSSVPSNTICANDTITFNSSDASNELEYQFLFDNLSVSSFLSSPASFSSSNLTNDTDVSVVARSSKNCRDTSTINIEVNPLPNASLSESTGGTSICEDDNVTFTASGGDTYEFFINGSSIQGPGVNDEYTTTTLTSNDTVTSVVTNSFGCSKKADEEFNYFVIAKPNTDMIVSAPDTSICDGENITFTGQNAGVYEFFVNGLSTQGPSGTSVFSTNSLNNGDEVYVVGSSGGCSAQGPVIPVEVNIQPTASLSNTSGGTVICEHDLVDFTAGGGSEYEFFVDGISQGVPSTNNVFSSNTIQNNQTISVTAINGNCTDNASQTFSVNPLPNTELFSNSSTNEICDGDNITFQASGAEQYEFFIDGNSVQGPSTANSLINPTAPTGSSVVSVNGTSSAGCEDLGNTILLINYPIPNVGLSTLTNEICDGDNVAFNASGADDYQFYVNGVAVTSFSGNDTYSSTSLSDQDEITVYGESNGCGETSAPIEMVVNPSPNISLTNNLGVNAFCENEFVTYEANGATEYEFFINGASQGAPSTNNEITSASFPLGSFTLSVEGESLGCSSSTQVNVLNNSQPSTAIQVSGGGVNEVCSGNNITFEASGANGYEFFINGVSQGASSPINVLSSSTLNNGDVVSVEGVNTAGCIDITSLSPTTVYTTPTVNLVSSNAGTPICDGDEITFTGSGADNYEFFLNGVSLNTISPNNQIAIDTLVGNDEVEVIGYTPNCQNVSNSITFNVFPNPVVNILNNGSTTICDTELTDIEASGADNYQFYINGNPVGTLAPNPAFNSTLNNSDTISVVGETNGCTSFANDSIIYTVVSTPIINVTNNSIGNELCFGDTVEFEALGASEYEIFVNGYLFDQGSQVNYSVPELNNNDEVSFIGYNAHCPSATNTTVFTVFKMNLELDYTPSSMICEDQQVEFTASGADEYSFYLNGNSVQNQSANNTYVSSNLSDLDELTFVGHNLTTQCNQDLGDYVLMNVIPAPTITVLSPLEFCEGDFSLLESNSMYGNEWEVNGSPFSDTIEIEVDTTAVVQLHVTKGGDNDVWSQGKNAKGILGNNTILSSATPVRVKDNHKFKQIVAGNEFIVGLSENNEVFTWGDNTSGQLGNGTFTSEKTPKQVPTLSDVKSVAASANNVMAVLNSGEVYVWGNNNWGQLGTGTSGVINFPFLNTNLTDVDSIVGGRDHFVILKNDGTVWTVGNNSEGQLGINTLVNEGEPVQVSTLNNIIKIGSGAKSSYAINDQDELYVWGNNSNGQLGLGDFSNRIEPVISNLENVSSATGGANHSLFVTNEHRIYVAGGNSFGQLGTGNTTTSNSLKRLDVTGVAEVSAGQYHSLLRRRDNSVFGFGNNEEKQLSNSSNSIINEPILIEDVDGVVQIAAAQHSSHFIFGEFTSCSSSTVETEMLPVPDAIITANGDTLETINGQSYQWYFNGNIIPNATNQTFLATEQGNYTVVVELQNGCISSSDVYFHQLVNIAVQEKNEISIYPVPAVNTVTISGLKTLESSFEVYDQTGRIVPSTFGSQTESHIQLDISHLEKGVYTIVISSKMNNENKVLKFVKH